MDAPLVSIITVNFNQWEETCELLRSLERITYPNWEAIVVDNGSEMSAPNEIEERFSSVRFLFANKNLGFAGGNNFALASCAGEFILFLNNDVEVEPDFLEPLVHAFSFFPKLGAASPRIHFFHRPGRLQYAGSTEMSPYTIRNSTFGHGQKDQGQYLDSRLTAYIHGAAMIVSKAVIEDVGTMYEDYFLYYEEYDWCHRMKKKGFQIAYVGDSLVHHKESVSTGKKSPLKIFYLTRNRLLFARRNFSWGQRIFAMLFFAFVSIPKNILRYSLKGEWPLAQAFLKGVWWNLTH
jgi:GT2 family glycosyltransferase